MQSRTSSRREPVHKGPHVFSYGGKPRPLEEVRAEYPLAGYRSNQILMAPGLLDVFNDPRLIDLVEEFLGCVPTLYSLNGWWSFPAERPELKHSQYFHRDIDDWRFLALFLYLTDVDETTGPHQVISRSHTLRGMQDLIYNARAEGRKVGDFDAAQSFVSSMGFEFSADCERLFGDSIVNATGPTGTTAYLVNTMALHRGLMPRQSPRLVICTRYGLGSTCNSSDLEHGPFSSKAGSELPYPILREIDTSTGCFWISSAVTLRGLLGQKSLAEWECRSTAPLIGNHEPYIPNS